MAELTHPALPGVTITVPDESAWIRLRNGWVHASQADEVAPDPEDELAPEPEEAVYPAWSGPLLDYDKQKES